MVIIREVVGDKLVHNSKAQENIKRDFSTKANYGSLNIKKPYSRDEVQKLLRKGGDNGED